MSRKVSTKLSGRAKERPTMIPYKKSEIFFVFPYYFSHKSSDKKETIIIDAQPKIVKKILSEFDCKIESNSKNQNFVYCDFKLFKSLKEVLYNFQEQHIIKFAVFCPCKCRSKISHLPRDVVANITIENDTTKPINFEIEIPKEDEETVRDDKYSKHDGRNVKIVANSVDGVARTAKLMGVLLDHFDDNCLDGKFTGYGRINFLKK